MMAEVTEKNDTNVPEQSHYGHQNDEVINWSNLSAVFRVRDKLTTNLLEAYTRCFHSAPNTNTKELILITGPSGVGKTSLALMLEKHVSIDNGLMAWGKFDPLEANLQAATSMIYGPFTEAFTHCVGKLLSAGNNRVQSFKHAIERAMDPTEVQVLREVIPTLDKVFDFQPFESNSGRKTIMKGVNAEDRLIQIFVLFVRTICSLGIPIVLFLDDIQWANQSSFQLLASLLLSEDLPDSRLMLLCTCRSEEVSVEHPLSTVLRDLEDQGVRLTEIKVSNMTKDEVEELISGVFHVSVADSQPFSNIVFQHTGGNLLFVLQLLKFFHEEGVIQLAPTGQWNWQMNKVLIAANVGSITMLVERKVRSLDDTTRGLLKVASCLGSTFPTVVLSFVGATAADDFPDAIHAIEKSGLVILDKRSGTARFAHDRFQQTVYQLISKSELKSTHLDIGRKLRTSMPQNLHQNHLLLIAHQISLGINLISDANERQEVAELFYQAGQLAALSSAFKTASAYLNLGLRLLGPEHWTDQYNLSLCMHNFAAEVEYYNGDLQRVDELIEVVLKRARSFEDTMQAQLTRIYSLGSRENMSQALEESLNVLQRLGELFPRKPSFCHVMLGMIRFKLLVRGKSDEDFLRLPLMRDNRKQSMRLMLLVTFFAFFVSGKHVPLVAFRVIENTLKHGMSEMACVALGQLSLVYAIQGKVDEAYRFNQLALRLFDRFQAKEWQGRVAVASYAIVFPLKRPFRDSLDPLQAAHRGILVLGDIHFSVLCLALCGALSFSAGLPLAHVEKGMRRCRAICIKYRQKSVQSSCDLRLQLVLNLIGASSNPVVLTGEVTNEEVALQDAKQKSATSYAWWHFVKLQLAVYMNDLTVARVVLSRLNSVDKKTLLPFAVAVFLFFEGLASAMLSSRQDRKRARRAAKKLKFFAKHAPSNYLNKVHLLDAELAFRDGKVDEALANYKISINLAHQEGLIQDQALACERACHALRACSRFVEAEVFLHQARFLYSRWGAQVKVDQLSTV